VAEKETRSVAELFAAATDWSREDGEGDWTAVAALHFVGSREVLDRSLEMAASDDPRLRARAADILGQLGIPERTFPEESVTTVTRLVSDPDPHVIQAAAYALGHLSHFDLLDVRSTKALIRISDHDDPEVRHAAAWALAGTTDPEAIAALIRLTEDDVAKTRDWATFGLGEMGKLNTPEIRDALHRRLDDVDGDTRFEAICGLARCRDPRVARPLIEALGDEPENGHLVAAACKLLNLPNEPEPPTTEALLQGLRSVS
jgi:HEAT repeats/PBS lyase HEAT-like repeat